MYNTWQYDDILAPGSLWRPRNERLKLCLNKYLTGILGDNRPLNQQIMLK